MARTSARRQKQIERKRSKRKGKLKALAKRQPQGLAERIARASSSPILHCAFCGDFETQGIVQVLVSREFDAGLVAGSIFLVDTWCLGVKDAFARITTLSDYQENVVIPLKERFQFRQVAPACARRFVEEAIHYARQCGFEPHPGYRKAAPIFGNVDPRECSQSFEFGHDGRPHFVVGPGDTPERCRRVVQTLRDRLGEDGFMITSPFSPAEFLGEYVDVFDDGSFEDDDEGGHLEWDEDE